MQEGQPDLLAEPAEQREPIERGQLVDLPQGLLGILHVHVAQHHSQAEAPQDLLHAGHDVLRVQAVVPAARYESAPAYSVYQEAAVCPGLHISASIYTLGMQAQAAPALLHGTR